MKSQMVIEFDAKLKPVVEALVEHLAATEKQLSENRGGRSVDYLSVEETVADGTAKIERASHEALLCSLEPESQRIRVDGEVYSRCAKTTGHYRTLAGEVSFERWTYRELGRRNGKTIDPIALRVGVVGNGWLPATARAMSYFLQLGTSREAAKAVEQARRLPYSRSSFERLPHDLGRRLAPHQAKIEEELIEEYDVPAKATSLSVSADRVSMAIEEPRSLPVGRPRKDAPKRPIERKFRMAYCGTLTLHDESGQAIHTIRYGCMPQGDSVGLAESLADDVMSLLRKRPELDVTLLADGAPEIWNLLEDQLCHGVLKREPHRLIDFWHLVEKLAAAARVIHGQEAKAVVGRWTKKLKSDAKAAKAILRELRRSGMKDVRLGDARPVHEAITYIENNHERMNYADAVDAGRPIGSGNVEATCKSLVGVRMKRPGARWKNDTGHHVMQLRAFALSDRWDQAMDKLFKILRKPVQRVA